ncbi:MAG: hypothetical protein ACRDST_02115, partial [Pseudonocardiaceae bacterium]
IRDCVAAARSDKAGDFVRRWYEEWQPDLAARIPPLRDVDLAALDDRQLDEHVGAVLALYERGLEINIALHAPLGLMLAELAFACRDLLGWTDAEAFELLIGLSTASTEPARQVVELAEMAAQRPAVRDLLGQVDAGTADRIAAADPAFAAALDTYRREFCCRALSYEIAEPTIAEVPELSLRLLADQLARGHDRAVEVTALARRRAHAVAAARSALARDRPPNGIASSGRWPAPSASIRCGRAMDSSRSASRSRCCAAPSSRSVPGWPLAAW